MPWTESADTDFVMTVRQDTDEIYRRLDDAQDDELCYERLRVQSMDASEKPARSEVKSTSDNSAKQNRLR
ncbi:hypothetical protein Tco_0468108 [Tanacetum coccineum]